MSGESPSGEAIGSAALTLKPLAPVKIATSPAETTGSECVTSTAVAPVVIEVRVGSTRWRRNGLGKSNMGATLFMVSISTKRSLHLGSRTGCSRSAEFHLTDVDVDHQHIQDRSTVRASGIGAPTSRKPYAARFSVLRCELRSRKATGDVDLVVMSAQQQVVAEKEILNEAVSLDRPRKVRTQDAPRLSALLPWLGLLNSYVARPKKEGRREIGIERLAVEIGEMERVPGCVHLVTCEGISRRASLRYRRAIELFDGNSISSEHRPLIRGAERSHRRAFLVQPRREPTRSRVRQKTFEAKKASTGHDRCFDFRVFAPTI